MRCVSRTLVLSALVLPVVLLPGPALAVANVGEPLPPAAGSITSGAGIAVSPAAAPAGGPRSWGAPVVAEPSPGLIVPPAPPPTGWERVRRSIIGLGQRVGSLFGN